MGCWNLLSGPNSNHRLETTVYRPLVLVDQGHFTKCQSHVLLIPCGFASVDAIGLQPPRPATEVSRALRARSVPGVSLGVSLGPFGLRAPECPKSVPRVSPECQKGVPDTPRTLSGHFLDTPEPGARRAPETPRGTLPGHSRDTSGPKGPRDSCSRPGGLQP